MQSKVDLHTHTTYSDGACSPGELIQKAKEKGIDIISITDHDNTKGIKEATNAGKDLGVEVIPGVEISSEISNREIHILGYFFDPDNQELEHYLNFFREERIKRAGRIVNKLRNLGFDIDLEDVLNKARN
jgi:predicted metal-dependent phosphoesterase TrpH